MADDYASHYAVLAAAVARTPGPVVEFGCGEGSTPMLHYLCQAQGKTLLTLESNLDWLNRFTAYSTPSHNLYFVKDWLDWMHGQGTIGKWAKWGVAFVDSAPGEMRRPIIEWLRERAQIIVAHDSERDYATGANYQYERVKPLFKHVSEFQRWRPYTLILSDEVPFFIEPCDQKWIPTAEQQAYFDAKGIKA